jgi:hypothetical protein
MGIFNSKNKITNSNLEASNPNISKSDTPKFDIPIPTNIPRPIAVKKSANITSVYIKSIANSTDKHSVSDPIYIDASYGIIKQIQYSEPNENSPSNIDQSFTISPNSAFHNPKTLN